MALKNSYDGFQNEKLANFILSKFSFVSQPVTNVDDSTAVDFYCTLFDIKSIEKNKKGKKGEKTYEILVPSTPFTVQIKSSKTTNIKNYGNRLDRIKVPYFIGIVNNKELNLTLYAGIGIPMAYSHLGEGNLSNVYILKANYVKKSDCERFSDYEIKDKVVTINFKEILKIDKEYSYDENPDFLIDFKKACDIMQQNVATRCRNEFIFENLESKNKFIFTGSTSINKCGDNFFMRLTEVFANLRYKKENRIENVTDEFETYQKCYFALKSFYKEKFPSVVDQEYEKTKVAIKDEKTSVDSTANYQVPTYDASTCTVTEIKNFTRME